MNLTAAPRAHMLRRILGTCLVLASIGALIYVESRRPVVPEGASIAYSELDAFAQVPMRARISTSWFCPGVAAGDGVDSGRVVIANPTDVDITAAVTLLSDGNPEQQVVIVPARSRNSVDLLRGRTKGVVVPIVEVIGSHGIVEQQLEFAAGDTTSLCVTATSSSWFFADGFTLEGSRERLILANPFPESAVVNMSFSTADGQRRPTALQGFIMPARSVKSFDMSKEGANEEQLLAIEVRATTGKIIASRAQHYLGGGRLGYSTTLGTPLARNKWWFAGGQTAANTIEKLVLYNPAEQEITVDAVFLHQELNATVDSAGSVPPIGAASIVVPAGEVVSLNTELAASLPKGAHGIVLSTANGVGFVAEHAISKRTKTSAFTALTQGTPDGLTSRVWWIPTGVTPDSRDALSILNTTSEAGSFSIVGIGPGGEFPLTGLTDVPLLPAGVMNVSFPADVTDGQLIVRSTEPIVVRRQLNRGHGLVGFSSVLALPQRGAR